MIKVSLYCCLDALVLERVSTSLTTPLLYFFSPNAFFSMDLLLSGVSKDVNDIEAKEFMAFETLSSDWLPNLARASTACLSFSTAATFQLLIDAIATM